MLRVFADHVVIEHAGPIGEENRQPAKEQDAHIDEEGNAGVLFAAVRALHQLRAQPGKQRRGHCRHGDSPQHAAHAGQEAVIDKQLRSEAERGGEEEAKACADGKRPAVDMLERTPEGKDGKKERAKRAAERSEAQTAQTSRARPQGVFAERTI